MEIVDTDVDRGAPGARWPAGLPGNSAAVGRVETTFSALRAPDGLTVSLVRNLISHGQVVVTTVAWTRRHDDEAAAEECFGWLMEQGERLVLWVVGALALGAAFLETELDAGVATLRARRADEAALQVRIADQLDAEARVAAKINVFFSNRDSRPVLTLERGSSNKPLWTIAFNEAWERERFWDWLKWQRARFDDFVALAAECAPLDLDRRLLKEMLVTEWAVKNQGLGAGGRRPLRFWKGDL